MKNFGFSHWISKNRFLYQFILTIISIIFVISLSYLTVGLFSSPPSNQNSDTFIPLTEVPSTAETVETGIFALNLYSLETASNTFYLDFYIWFRWKGKLDPIANLEFSNAVEDWGATTVFDKTEPERLPDGKLYQLMRVERRFVQPFNLARYPLDNQSLKVTIENSIYTLDKLVYVPDSKQSGFSSNLSIPGWKIDNYDLISLIREYTTNFGDSRLRDKSIKFSAIQYSLQVSRPLNFFIWKLLLPLVIVLCSAWSALLLNPQYTDSRIILPMTALLTTVFLQQSYSAGLPDIGYLILLDKIYALVYTLIMATILEVIITADWVVQNKVTDLTKVVRQDRLILGIQVSVLVLGILLLVLLS
jgi:hypothetical protein